MEITDFERQTTGLPRVQNIRSPYKSNKSISNKIFLKFQF